MSRISQDSRQTGFTLIELMVALGIFLVISAVAFSLLGISQQRYQAESQLTNSFQEARLALDEIVRDVNTSGFPPANQFSTLPANIQLYASTPFAWSPGYPATPCQIGTAGGGTCTTASGGSTPGDFDLIVETNINPQDPNSTVQWIRYRLQGTTLYRSMAAKTAANPDPDAATSAPTLMLPYVQNVMNNASAGQIAQIQAAYPGMFPGGGAVPIFSYICDTPGGPQACPGAAGSNFPANIRDVTVTLIVMAPTLDQQAGGRPLVVQLNGCAHRVNPSF